NAIRKSSKKEKDYSVNFGRMYALVLIGRYQDAINLGLELAKIEECNKEALNCVGYCYQQLFLLDGALDAYEKSGSEDSIYSKLCVLHILRRDREILDFVEKNPWIKERAEELVKVAKFRLGATEENKIENGIKERYLPIEYKQPKSKSFVHTIEFSAM
ncbi:MAG: hypothetical protein QXT63_05055, partial [Thermoplasmata archaeon]